VTDQRNVGVAKAGYRFCRECERLRLVKRNYTYRKDNEDRYMANNRKRDHGHGAGAMTWRVTGKCKRGHDITTGQDATVEVAPGKRTCRLCRAERGRERYIESKMREATKAADRERSAKVHEAGHPTRTNGKPDRAPTAAETGRILELLRQAEDATPWEREQLRAMAEQIRKHGVIDEHARIQNRRSAEKARHARKRDGLPTKRS
jgi:hypothetical protein